MIESLTFCYFVVYLMFAFIAGEPNPMAWPLIGRAILAFVLLFLSCLIAANTAERS